MVANVFGEDMVVVGTNGAGGSLQAVVPSGPPPEGDKARVAALSADGSKAVVTSILSDNATIVDVPGRAVEAIVDVGDRPSEVEITPDGTKAVVANLDSNFASVIDLGTHAVTDITISRRAGQVEISPDGTYAYLAVVADGDGVWRIDLNTLSVAGPKRLTGNMGGVLYAFNQSSGLTLSHDGATLVTCNSFDDTITVLDTAAWSVVATVPVGDFPTRAVFAADDSGIWVANRDGDTITVVDNTPGFPVTGTIAVGQQPYEMVVNAAGTELWVSNFQDSNVGVVDLASGVMLRTTPVPNAPAGLGYDGTRNELYVASGTWSVTLGPGPVFSFAQAGELSVIDAVSGSVTDQLDTGLPPAMLAYAPSTGTIAVPSPLGDGLSLIEAGGPVAAWEYGGPEAALGLAPPSPNPTRATTDLRFSAPGGLPVSLDVFDVSGRRVVRLADGVVAAGPHRVRWDGRDARGAPVAPGVYWVRLEAGNRSESRRLVVVR
jgi:YVTN family beta-propeller protein